MCKNERHEITSAKTARDPNSRITAYVIGLQKMVKKKNLGLVTI